jgi:hypothetical protein
MNALTAGTVMERTHTPLSVWFWGACLANRISMEHPMIFVVAILSAFGLGSVAAAFGAPAPYAMTLALGATIGFLMGAASARTWWRA